MIFRLSLLLLLASAGAADAHGYRPSQPFVFGVYSQAYLERSQIKRWHTLCRGAGRYQAMSEAYEAGKRDPCNPPCKNC